MFKPVKKLSEMTEEEIITEYGYSEETEKLIEEHRELKKYEQRKATAMKIANLVGKILIRIGRKYLGG